jgi:SAM-dependent methyltransferase
VELLIGAGNSRDKRIIVEGRIEWSGLTTLDIDPNAGADVTHDLTEFPYPFGDDSFEEIHAYEVLEHTGQQGDWRFFFKQFQELWRILKPGGYLIGTSPAPGSAWEWGDPGHTRVMSQECMTFLHQPAYTEQVGKTPMTDYRHVYTGDFDAKALDIDPTGQIFRYILQAIKPSRISI